MTVGSLFSGIGGFDLGLERAGMVIKWQVEIDDFCNKVLEKHWPKVNRYRDIKELRGDELEPVDLICGGFPCQPFSAAGKRRSKEDDRYLWPEMLRVIRAVRPNWIIGENVAGIVSLALDDVLSDLENEGYACQSFIIPACAVNAPHRRDRVWIISNTKHYGQPSSEERASGAARNRNASGEEEVCKSKRSVSTRVISSNINDSRSRTSRDGGNREWQEKNKGQERFSQHESSRYNEAASNTSYQRLQRSEWKGTHEKGKTTYGSIAECNRSWTESWIQVATSLCRVDDGLPSWMVGHRTKRLKALGNAVVPQIVEIIGRAIIETEKG